MKKYASLKKTWMYSIQSIKKIMRPTFTRKLSKCSDAYYTDPKNTPEEFYAMILDVYGIKITMGDSKIVDGISDIEIVDDQKYLMFELKYS